MCPNKLIIGLTGGIGSGKTAASDYFEKLGIAVIDTDVVARELVIPDSPTLAEIASHFGAEILLANGELDRAQLRQLIFQSPAEKEWLENLLHPLIREQTRRQLLASKSLYSILASPLLLETDQHQLCQKVLVIDVPEAVQIARSCDRDNNDIAQIKRIMASQLCRDQRLLKADDVIDNSHSIRSLHQNIDTLHQQFLQLAKKKIP